MVKVPSEVKANIVAVDTVSQNINISPTVLYCTVLHTLNKNMNFVLFTYQ